MYIKKVRIDESQIDGNGVFTIENISENEIVWMFKQGYDQSLSKVKFQNLPQTEKDYLSRTAYLSPWSKQWIFPPKGDPAEYTNHSSDNNLSVKFDPMISPEPFFIANQSISAGDELTNNYHEFDEITQTQEPDWAV